MKIPKITVHGWTEDGPQLTIHRNLSGFRNRHARRRGESADELVGHDLPLLENNEPRASMIWTASDDEAWAFAAPHVYELDVLLDGEVTKILVDARENHAQHRFTDGLQLLEWRALEPEEVDEVLENGPEQPTNVSDGAESQEELPELSGPPEEITSLTGAQVEWTAEEQVPVTPEESDALLAEKLAEHASTEDSVDDDSVDPDDDDDSSSGPHNFDGTVAEFHELVEAVDDDELAVLVEHDTRKGVRETAQHELDRRAAAKASPDDDAAAGGTGPVTGEVG